MKNKNIIKNKKEIIIGVTFILVVVILFSLMTLQKEKKMIVLADNCGLMPGAQAVSHTIRDEADCRVQCRNQCGTIDMKYDSNMFYVPENVGCYTCNCTCVS